MWCLLPWLGTCQFLTLERVLRIKCADQLKLRNLEPARPFYMQFAMKADEDEFFRTVSDELAKAIDPLDLVYPKELPIFNKYDEYLPPALVIKSFSRNILDLDGLRENSYRWLKN